MRLCHARGGSPPHPCVLPQTSQVSPVNAAWLAQVPFSSRPRTSQPSPRPARASPNSTNTAMKVVMAAVSLCCIGRARGRARASGLTLPGIDCSDRIGGDPVGSRRQGRIRPRPPVPRKCGSARAGQRLELRTGIPARMTGIRAFGRAEKSHLRCGSARAGTCLEHRTGVPARMTSIRAFGRAEKRHRRFSKLARPHPPKSSSMMSLRSTPRSRSILITAAFITGGPHM